MTSDNYPSVVLFEKLGYLVPADFKCMCGNTHQEISVVQRRWFAGTVLSLHVTGEGFAKWNGFGLMRIN
jgi:hypothetical protein